MMRSESINTVSGNLIQMALRVGLVTAAHLHAYGYAHGLKQNFGATMVGIWDDHSDRGKSFAESSDIPFVSDREEFLQSVDAVVIVSENNRHAELVEFFAAAGKHILCEKPIGACHDHLDRIKSAVEKAGVTFMTAFPCRFSPAYQRLKDRVQNGEIGNVVAICATNRGRCPMGWFVEKELSGGGAMIDHVVHVTDLLRDLLGADPLKVYAQIGNNTYGQEWDDTAMVSLDFPNEIFVTLDSSWSRPPNYKTWGDVTLTVVGEAGLIELDMFGPAVDMYTFNGHTQSGFLSDLDSLMIQEFVSACLEGRAPKVSLNDGAAAAKVAIAGYESVAKGLPVSLA